MTQANKKPTAPQGAKFGKAAFSAVESTRSSAENVVKIGGAAMKDFLSSSAGEAKKAQEKAMAFGRENVEQMAKSADAATKVMYEVIGLSRDGVEACVECGNMTAALAKDLSSEATEAANQAFAEGLEISKELFACRTINDVMELQNRAVKQALDNFFSQSAKISNRMFEYSTEALEPINERVSQATEKLNKVFTA